jgi:hypothetical protein
MSTQTSNLKPVLVTGGNLSGVKALAEVLAICPSIRYEKSPFNIQENNSNYIFVTPENEQILRSINPLNNPEAASKPPKERKFLSGIFAEISGYFKTLSSEKKGYRMMVADTKLFFMAPWIHENFHADVVILLRHPFYLASLQKRHGIFFDFRQLDTQQYFIEKHLPGFKAKIEDFAKNPKTSVENAAFSWVIFASLMNYYQREYPNWIFFKTEVFDMQRKFRECYQMLELPFTREISDQIVNLRQSFDGQDAKMMLDFTDISNLSDTEISLIRKTCEPLYDEFYAH